MHALLDLIEIRADLTQRQRWGHYLLLIYAAAALLIGINLRDSTLYATRPYQNVQAGIVALYPRNWLLTESTPSTYVFRVEDVSVSGFKTLIQVAIRAVGPETNARNIFDELSFIRAQTFDGYRAFTVEEFRLPNEEELARALRYTFVAAEANPFLESYPTVVAGLDVLVIRRGQAIVITFQSDATTFEQNYPTFEQFLNNLEF